MLGRVYRPYSAAPPPQLQVASFDFSCWTRFQACTPRLRIEMGIRSHDGNSAARAATRRRWAFCGTKPAIFGSRLKRYGNFTDFHVNSRSYRRLQSRSTLSPTNPARLCSSPQRDPWRLRANFAGAGRTFHMCRVGRLHRTAVGWWRGGGAHLRGRRKTDAEMTQPTSSAVRPSNPAQREASRI